MIKVIPISDMIISKALFKKWDDYKSLESLYFYRCNNKRTSLEEINTKPTVLLIPSRGILGPTTFLSNWIARSNCIITLFGFPTIIISCF